MAAWTLPSILFIMSFFLLSLERLEAYPHFIGHGYNSCLVCHYNPQGNGPLNDYGRAVSATAISARWFESEFKTEDDLANESGFFFNSPKNDWFRPSFDYRGLYLIRNLGEDNSDGEYIHMMADFNLVLKLSDKLFFSGSYGYAPKPLALRNSQEEIDNTISREHYLGYRKSKSFGVYAGLMDKIFGIRVAEHVAFSRSVTNLNQNDQAHGIQIHYSLPKFDIGVGGFIGNLNQEAPLRQVGVSAKVDYLASGKTKFGGSILKSSSDFVDTYMAAFHAETGTGDGSSVLIEIGQVTESSVAIEGEEESSTYANGSIYFKMARGVYLFNNLQYLSNERGSRYQLGPGIQIFPAQRVEARFELFNSRSKSEESSTEDSWTLLGQTHLWF